MVRSLANDLPKNVNLGEAKAWAQYSQSSGASLMYSHGIVSISDDATGKATFVFQEPMKRDDYVVLGTTDDGYFSPTSWEKNQFQGRTYNYSGSLLDGLRSSRCRCGRP